YALIQPTTTANISPAALTLTAAPNTKPYDATTSAAAVPTVKGLLGSDTATGLSEAYTDPNPSAGKTLVVTRYTINDGNNGNNYVVSTVSHATGVITSLLPATRFQVTAPTTATSGSPISVTVSAIDQNNS